MNSIHTRNHYTQPKISKKDMLMYCVESNSVLFQGSSENEIPNCILGNLSLSNTLFSDCHSCSFLCVRNNNFTKRCNLLFDFDQRYYRRWEILEKSILRSKMSIIFNAIPLQISFSCLEYLFVCFSILARYHNIVFAKSALQVMLLSSKKGNTQIKLQNNKTEESIIGAPNPISALHMPEK